MKTANDMRTLLVIEDNALNREMLEVILEDTYRVLTAENGAEGLKVLEENGTDISLILLDIQMPVMNGYEFLKAVGAAGRFTDIPVIVTTSSDSDEEQLRCLGLGASDFVVKPYKPEIVKKRVEGLIRLRETALMLHKVEHDEVTGLFNRESFTFRVHRCMETGAGDYDMVCMVVESYLSLSGRYGAKKCNAALKNLADYLTAHLPASAIIGRIDSAQIAVFAPHMEFEAYVAIAEALRRDEFDSGLPSIKINTGVYPSVDRALNVSTVLANAISSLDGVRYRYGKIIGRYDDAIRDKQRHTQLLADRAEEGVREKHFKVWYQPKHNAATDTTGGAEALIRWIHPEMGFISPGAFVPVFESNGFISRIDLYVVETVCSDLRRWMDAGKKVVPVSANISQVDFDIPDLADKLEGIVDRYGIPHELMHFEITESANAIDKEKKAACVKQLKEKGFSVELDDFGSGYSNLSTLADLPIDVIKLDMSLVRNMFEPSYSAILRGALYTAAELNKQVVSEGVETIEQVEALRKMCEGRIELYYQGYYFSKPLPADRFEAYLEEH